LGPHRASLWCSQGGATMRRRRAHILLRRKWPECKHLHLDAVRCSATCAVVAPSRAIGWARLRGEGGRAWVDKAEQVAWKPQVYKQKSLTTRTQLALSAPPVQALTSAP
jgi:hypothetical protein